MGDNFQGFAVVPPVKEASFLNSLWEERFDWGLERLANGGTERVEWYVGTAGAVVAHGGHSAKRGDVPQMVANAFVEVEMARLVVQMCSPSLDLHFRAPLRAPTHHKEHPTVFLRRCWRHRLAFGYHLHERLQE